MRLIDADALIDELMERYCKECKKRRGIKNGKYRIIYEIGGAPCRACEVDDIKAELEDAPTAESERKKGEWVHGKEKSREMRGSAVVSISYDGWYCSECGKKVEDEFRPFYRFCRYCGAENQSTMGQLNDDAQSTKGGDTPCTT